MNGKLGDWYQEWREFRNEQEERHIENQKVILAIQERISDVREIDIPGLRVEVAMLKIKAGVWGALAGLIPAFSVLVWWIVSRNK